MMAWCISGCCVTNEMTDEIANEMTDEITNEMQSNGEMCCDQRRGCDKGFGIEDHLEKTINQH